MSKSTKYIVWVDERDGEGWQEQGDGPLTLLQAQRIAREIRSDCGCRTTIKPAFGNPPVDWVGNINN